MTPKKKIFQNFQGNDNEILSPTKKGIKLNVSKLNILNFESTIITKEETNYEYNASLNKEIDQVLNNKIINTHNNKKNNLHLYDYNNIKNSTHEFYIDLNEQNKQSIKYNDNKFTPINKKEKYNLDETSSSSISSSLTNSVDENKKKKIKKNNCTIINILKKNNNNNNSNIHHNKKHNIYNKYNISKKTQNKEIHTLPSNQQIEKKNNNNTYNTYQDKMKKNISKKNTHNKKNNQNDQNKDIQTKRTSDQSQDQNNHFERRILRSYTRNNDHVKNNLKNNIKNNNTLKRSSQSLRIDSDLDLSSAHQNKRIKYDEKNVIHRNNHNNNNNNNKTASNNHHNNHHNNKTASNNHNNKTPSNNHHNNKTPSNNHHNNKTASNNHNKNYKKQTDSKHTNNTQNNKYNKTKTTNTFKHPSKDHTDVNTTIYKSRYINTYTMDEVQKSIKSNTIKLVKENSCEYQDGIIYETIQINDEEYSIGEDVLIFYTPNNNNNNSYNEKRDDNKNQNNNIKENIYLLKKGKISSFYKSTNSKVIQVEICFYYDESDEQRIRELEKKQTSRRCKEDFNMYLHDDTKYYNLLGNINFTILDANYIYKKIYVYNEIETFEEDTHARKGKNKFLCTHYIKDKEDRLCFIPNQNHWDNLVLGSSDLYYYFANEKKLNKNKSLKLIIEKLKINDKINDTQEGNHKKKNNKKEYINKAQTTTNVNANTHTKTLSHHNKSKTTKNKESSSTSFLQDVKKKSDPHNNDFQSSLKEDQENYYINLLKNIKDPTDKAIRMMQLDVVPKYLPCREKEIKEVHGFLESGIKQSGSNQILYISGMPGTGKTATVYSVIQLLQNKSRKKLLPTFNVYEINGMNVVHPNAAYQVFYKQLFNKKPPNALNSFKIIDRLFNRSQKDNRDVSILIIDEIDYLITKTQKVLFTLFDWPTKINSKLILIAISNTMDLPDRLIPRCRSRLAFGRLVFSPYKGDEIEKIIKERLENCKEIIDHTAIQLCARKVANVSGDIRKALQICRKAFENKRGHKIVPRDITEATNQLFDSPLTSAINYLPWAFKIFLTCLIIELRIINEFVIPYKKVVNRYKILIETSGKYIGMCSDNELFKIMLDKLVKMGILLIRPYIPLENTSKNKSKEALLGFNESSKKTNNQKITRAQVSPDIDKESGDMGIELNIETQLIITALMKDPDCSKKLNFY
ncbi:origin recognition complex subunit 1, putative [Plasmodium reichenowi]|uniref:Origin recognition complex subunit 1 n=1 Tax=Plasmodium reichenowi TaxID=5854 RepID=A0A060S0L7_PLARE|nr:origin recognition complex subunit 1, putative [Plasmodium reichenowi]